MPRNRNGNPNRNANRAPASSPLRRHGRRLAAAALATALIAPLALSPAHGHDEEIVFGDPVSIRMAMMSDAGASMGMLGAIAKGEAEFEPRVVEAALRTIQVVALGFPSQFPKGAMSDESEASPKIWEDKAGFQEKASKFLIDATAALETKPADVAQMKEAMALVGADCGGCHKAYRVKKN